MRGEDLLRRWAAQAILAADEEDVFHTGLVQHAAFISALIAEHALHVRLKPTQLITHGLLRIIRREVETLGHTAAFNVGDRFAHMLQSKSQPQDEPITIG